MIGPVLRAQRWTVALVVAALMCTACSGGSKTSAEVRICRAFQKLGQEGPRRTGAQAEAAVRAIQQAGTPTDAGFHSIQQHTSSLVQGQVGLPAVDSTYLQDHCGKLGVPLTATST
jgi:hypothetical protein